MSYCTVRGVGRFPPLPEAEVTSLKEFLSQLAVPQYVTSKIKFENLWKQCVESVG